jgi:hypothetical protein
LRERDRERESKINLKEKKKENTHKLSTDITQKSFKVCFFSIFYLHPYQETFVTVVREMLEQTSLVFLAVMDSLHLLRLIICKHFKMNRYET